MHHSHLILAACSWLIRCSSAVMLRSTDDYSLKTILMNGSVHWSSETILSFPGSAAFTNATERWDIFAPPTYNGAISPATEADVVAAIKLATKNNISFLATGGRHGYTTTLGNMQNGLAIDLSKFTDIEIDKEAETLTIGPGVHFGDIFDPVFEAGFQITTGTCSCVGMTGAGIGAGVGRLQGLEGLMIDALKSVRIVIANGSVLEASETINPNLFWGIRGAGANLGVIVSSTFNLTPLYKQGVWTMADLIFPAGINASYFKVLDSLFPLPAELTMETIMSYNTTNDEPQIMLSTVYAGYEEEAREVWAPILALGPTYSNIQQITWNQISDLTSFGLDQTAWCATDQIYAIFGVNLRNNSVDTWIANYNQMVNFWAETPEARDSVIVFETWPIQATVAVPENTTAYPWRETTTYVMMQMRWSPNATDAVSVEEAAVSTAKELRSKFVATSGYDNLAVYLNYAFGDETVEEVYGASKLPRLAQIKKEYDPNNVFTFNNPLPTAYPS